MGGLLMMVNGKLIYKDVETKMIGKGYLPLIIFAA